MGVSAAAYNGWPEKYVMGESGSSVPPLSPESFIVKLWLEEAGPDRSHVRWRAQVTHVPSGERQYVNELHEITDFIAAYLETMGVQVGWKHRLKRWFSP